MISTSRKAAEKLREQLINKCFEIGIGFRILVSPDKFGKASFSIKLDRQHEGDEVIDSGGVKIFLDSGGTAQIRDNQLDYRDGPGGGFFLNIMQEGQDE